MAEEDRQSVREQMIDAALQTLPPYRRQEAAMLSPAAREIAAFFIRYRLYPIITVPCIPEGQEGGMQPRVPRFGCSCELCFEGYCRRWCDELEQPELEAVNNLIKYQNMITFTPADHYDVVEGSECVLPAMVRYFTFTDQVVLPREGCQCSSLPANRFLATVTLVNSFDYEKFSFRAYHNRHCARFLHIRISGSRFAVPSFIDGMFAFRPSLFGEPPQPHVGYPYIDPLPGEFLLATILDRRTSEEYQRANNAAAVDPVPNGAPAAGANGVHGGYPRFIIVRRFEEAPYIALFTNVLAGQRVANGVPGGVQVIVDDQEQDPALPNINGLAARREPNGVHGGGQLIVDDHEEAPALPINGLAARGEPNGGGGDGGPVINGFI
ncbi:hypothetical protein Dimus_023026 [Dionaea muscipula]